MTPTPTPDRSRALLRWRWTVLATLVLLTAAAIPAEPQTGETTGTAAPMATTPQAAPADHQAELDAIADLLIDDHPRAAKAAAEKLLAAPYLTVREKARAQQLLAKAEQRIPAPMPPDPPTAPFPNAHFKVVEAQAGSGFASGRTGSFRIDATGVSFVADGTRSIAWGVPWSRVEGLSVDDGLWDTHHPLVLRQRGADPRYLAVTNGHGEFPAPDRLLSAFQRARREARARAAAGDEAAPQPPKERSR